MLLKSNKRVEANNQLCKQFEVDLLLGVEHHIDFPFAEEDQKFENIFGEG